MTNACENADKLGNSYTRDKNVKWLKPHEQQYERLSRN